MNETQVAREQLVGVVIPALNEAGNIGVVVGAIKGAGFELVVVADNGSTDDTASEAADAGAVVVSEPRRGYGYACAAGTAAAIERFADIVVYIDGDQSSRAAEIGAVVAPIVAGEADLVLGSRMLGSIATGAMPTHQRFGNWLVARIMKQLYRVDVTDLGPFRAVDARQLATLDMREMTFGWPTEMMVKMARRNLPMVEVPVSWDRRGTGESKVSGTLKGSVLAAWHILRVTFRYARGRPTTTQK